MKTETIKFIVPVVIEYRSDVDRKEIIAYAREALSQIDIYSVDSYCRSLKPRLMK